MRKDNIEQSLEVQSRLMKWSNEIHDLVGDYSTDACGEPQAEPQPIPERYKLLLIILQHESTITLNRPLLAKKPRTPAVNAALQACIHASRAIIETLDSQQSSGSLLASHSALAVWPLMTWSLWMSTFVLTYAALEGVTSIISAQRCGPSSLVQSAETNFDMAFCSH